MPQLKSPMNTPRLKLLLFLLGGGLTTLAGWGAEAYLQIPGIPGEAGEPSHKDWIELLAVTNGVVKGTAAQGPVSEMTIFKRLDKASPLLYQACAERTMIATARLALVTTDQDRLRYYDVALSNVVVWNVAARSSENSAWGSAVETLKLNYGEISWSYTELRGQTLLPLSYHTSYWDLLRRFGSSASQDALFSVSSMQKSGSEALLRWPGRSGRTYQIYSGSQVTGPYAPWTLITSSYDGDVAVAVPLRDGARFFVVEERP